VTTVVHLYGTIQIRIFTATLAVEEAFAVAGFAVVVSVGPSECIVYMHPVSALYAVASVFVFGQAIYAVFRARVVVRIFGPCAILVVFVLLATFGTLEQILLAYRIEIPFGAGQNHGSSVQVDHQSFFRFLSP